MQYNPDIPGVGKLDCLLQAIDFIDFIKMEPDKSFCIIPLANAESGFITEYRFYQFIHMTGYKMIMITSL